MNLALEKGERVTTEGKGRGEIGGEAGEVTGVVADAPTTDCLGKRHGTFSGWGMAAGKVEVLLVVDGFDVDGGAEVRLVNFVTLLRLRKTAVPVEISRYSFRVCLSFCDLFNSW